MNEINCYTDASTYQETACAGYVLVQNGRILEQNTQILYNKSNNFGEAYAAYLGIQALMRYAYTNCFLNLYSDSKITVDGIKYWMKNWLKNQNDNGVLYSSSGTPVANQEILKSIVYMIYYNRIPIRIYHQLGHKDPNSDKDISMVMEKFSKVNHTHISTELAKTICYYNDYIDKLTRNTLYETKNMNIPFSDYEVKSIYSRVLDQDILSRFNKLLYKKSS